ncbi:MAG: helix-turn-helix domain-containing protein, partial [Synechococcales bacterium]|nr:helix-turn-helix domain-containing protein [Synechococcales bacterium]
MILTCQYRLNPTPEQASMMKTWGELLRRHWNYALGQRLDWLNQTRCLHVARQRREFHYQVAHWLCQSYDLIAFENLNIKGLARTRLAKSILDAAWGGFINI